MCVFYFVLQSVIAVDGAPESRKDGRTANGWVPQSISRDGWSHAFAGLNFGRPFGTYFRLAVVPGVETPGYFRHVPPGQRGGIVARRSAPRLVISCAGPVASLRPPGETPTTVAGMRLRRQRSLIASQPAGYRMSQRELCPRDFVRSPSPRPSPQRRGRSMRTGFDRSQVGDSPTVAKDLL